jgi:predicted ester cyclase
MSFASAFSMPSEVASISMEAPVMSESANTALTRRWFEEVWNQRRDATVRELLHLDSVGHLEGVVTRGVDDFFGVRAVLLNAFPDFHITIEDLIAQGDHVTIRWSVKATQHGALLDIQATSAPVVFRGLTWLTFKDGRIVEGWDAWNQERLLGELRTAARAISRVVD